MPPLNHALKLTDDSILVALPVPSLLAGAN
jgi:hypothetical protein